MSNVGVVIPAFGDQSYLDASGEAWGSAVSQVAPGVDVRVYRTTGENLCDARNNGAALAISEGAEWLIFLDADDTLAPGYVEAVSEFFESADLIQPATLGVYPDGSTDDYPVVIERPKNLLDRNYIVIGAPIRANFFRMVGGFDDLPVLEDWDLWLRVQMAGGVVAVCPDAIYRVGVNVGGRNQTGMGSDAKLHHEVYRKIRKAYS